MKRKKILWLCSWYPSVAEPFNGDFIQRHAKAASLYHDIHVIYVGGFVSIGATESSLKHENELTEQVILYKSKKGFAGRFFNHLNWQQLFKKAVSDYIQQNGKPDMVHVHVPMKAGLIALWIKKKFDIPYLVTEHWGIYNETIEGKYSSRPAWFKKATKRIFSNAIACSSVSQYVAKNIRKYVSPDIPFTIIPNAVNTDLFFPKEKQASKFRFIHVSSMIKLKRTDQIVLGFSHLSGNAELIMVGTKDSFTEVTAGDLGLLDKSIFMTGEVSYEKVAEEMKQANCLVLFSEIENSPCVIGEALCCGLPVIATKVGGIPELVNNENSILVEAGNTTQLTEAMQRILDNYSAFDKKKIAELAQNKFSYSTIGKQFDDLYKSIRS